MSTAFNQVKAYLDFGVNLITAAAEAFLANPPIVIKQGTIDAINSALNGLKVAREALDGASDSTTWPTIATEVLAGISNLLPLVSTELGGAYFLFQTILGVVQAYLGNLNPPANLPPTPSPAMHAAAAHLLGEPADLSTALDEEPAAGAAASHHHEDTMPSQAPASEPSAE